MKPLLKIAPLAALALAALAAGALAASQGDQGKAIFEEHCAQCHRMNGEGLPPTFPALKGNPFVLGDPLPVIDTVLNGRAGKMGTMPTWKDTLNDQQVAAVISYIRQAWGNQAPPVTPPKVASRRR